MASVTIQTIKLKKSISTAIDSLSLSSGEPIIVKSGARYDLYVGTTTTTGTDTSKVNLLSSTNLNKILSLSNLSNVTIDSLSNNHILVYNSSTLEWENKLVDSSFLGYTNAGLSGVTNVKGALDAIYTLAYGKLSKVAGMTTGNIAVWGSSGASLGEIQKVTSVSGSSTDSQIPTAKSVYAAIRLASTTAGGYQGAFKYTGTYSQITATTGNTSGDEAIFISPDGGVYGTTDTLTGHVYKMIYTTSWGAPVEVSGGQKSGDWFRVEQLLSRPIPSTSPVRYYSGYGYLKNGATTNGNDTTDNPTGSFDLTIDTINTPDITHISYDSEGKLTLAPMPAGTIKANITGSNTYPTNVTIADIASSLLTNGTNPVQRKLTATLPLEIATGTPNATISIKQLATTNYPNVLGTGEGKGFSSANVDLDTAVITAASLMNAVITPTTLNPILKKIDTRIAEVAAAAAAAKDQLSELSDVAISLPQTGDILIYTAGSTNKWQNEALSIYVDGGGSYT